MRACPAKLLFPDDLVAIAHGSRVTIRACSCQKYSALFLQSEVTYNGTEYSSIDSQSAVARILLIGV